MVPGMACAAVVSLTARSLCLQEVVCTMAELRRDRFQPASGAEVTTPRKQCRRSLLYLRDLPQLAVAYTSCRNAQHVVCVCVTRTLL